jgi:hypothetical protein
MKTPIITIACAALASFTFLSCEDTGTNNLAEKPVPPKTGCKVVADLVVDPPPPNDKYICDDYGTCKSEIPPDDIPYPYNPDTVLIHQDVREWMDEQFASGKNDKMDIAVFDMRLGTREAPEPTVNCWFSSFGEGECIVNGEEMSLEEYREFEIKYQRENPLTYRQLTLSGEVILSGGLRHLLLTASEIEDLAQRYTEIAFEFYTEPVPSVIVPGAIEPGDGDIAVPPPADPAKDTGGPRCP